MKKSLFFAFIAFLILVAIAKTAVIVPQKTAYIVERLGKYRCTVTALMPGTAVVTAEVIDKTKTPNTKYTLTSQITVKANCAAVDITPSTVDELEIGETVQLPNHRLTVRHRLGNRIAAVEIEVLPPQRQEEEKTP